MPEHWRCLTRYRPGAAPSVKERRRVRRGREGRETTQPRVHVLGNAGGRKLHVHALSDRHERTSCHLVLGNSALDPSRAH